MVVFDMRLKMRPQIVDTLGQDGDLHESRTRILFVRLERLDDFLFFDFTDGHTELTLLFAAQDYVITSLFKITYEQSRAGYATV